MRVRLSHPVQRRINVKVYATTVGQLSIGERGQIVADNPYSPYDDYTPKGYKLEDWELVSSAIAGNSILWFWRAEAIWLNK